MDKREQLIRKIADEHLKLEELRCRFGGLMLEAGYAAEQVQQADKKKEEYEYVQQCARDLDDNIRRERARCEDLDRECETYKKRCAELEPECQKAQEQHRCLTEQHAEYTAKCDEAESQCQESKQRYNALQTDYQQSQAAAQEIRKQYLAAQSQLADLTAKRDHTASAVDTLQAECDALQARLDALTGKAADLKDKIASTGSHISGTITAGQGQAVTEPFSVLAPDGSFLGSGVANEGVFDLQIATTLPEVFLIVRGKKYLVKTSPAKALAAS